MHTQLSLPGSALGFMYLISAGLFTPRGNFQALFSYAYFPVNHTNTRTHERTNIRRTPLPISSLVLCHVSKFQKHSLGSRQICKGSSVMGFWASFVLPLCLPEGLAHLGSFSEHLGTVTGYFYRLEKKVIQEGIRFLRTIVPCHQLSPLNCLGSTRVALGVSAVTLQEETHPKGTSVTA